MKNMIHLNELWIGWGCLPVASRGSMLLALLMFFWQAHSIARITSELNGLSLRSSLRRAANHPRTGTSLDFESIVDSSQEPSLDNDFNKLAFWQGLSRRVLGVRRGGVAILWLSIWTFAYGFSPSMKQAGPSITKLTSIFDTGFGYTLEALSFELCLGALVHFGSTCLADTIEDQLGAWQEFISEKETRAER